MSSSKKDHLSAFVDGFKEGRAEQNQKTKADTTSVPDKIVESFIDGVGTTLKNPVRWLRSLLK
jgi:hypothetical protein